MLGMVEIVTNQQNYMNELLGRLDGYQWCPINSAFSKAFYQTNGYPHRKDVELTIEVIEGAPQDQGQSIDKFKPITPHKEYWLLISLQSESEPGVKEDFNYEFRGKRTILLDSDEGFKKAFQVLDELEEYLSCTFLKWLNKTMCK